MMSLRNGLIAVVVLGCSVVMACGESDAEGSSLAEDGPKPDGGDGDGVGDADADADSDSMMTQETDDSISPPESLDERSCSGWDLSGTIDGAEFSYSGTAPDSLYSTWFDLDARDDARVTEGVIHGLPDLGEDFFCIDEGSLTGQSGNDAVEFIGHTISGCAGAVPVEGELWFCSGSSSYCDGTTEALTDNLVGLLEGVPVDDPNDVSTGSGIYMSRYGSDFDFFADGETQATSGKTVPVEAVLVAGGSSDLSGRVYCATGTLTGDPESSSRSFHFDSIALAGSCADAPSTDRWSGCIE